MFQHLGGISLVKMVTYSVQALVSMAMGAEALCFVLWILWDAHVLLDLWALAATKVSKHTCDTHMVCM